MKKSIVLRGTMFLLIFSCLFYYTALTDAAQLTARSFGMGGAFTAVADDVEAVLYNPAGITDNGYVGLSFNTGAGIQNLDELDKIRGMENDFTYIQDNIGDFEGDVGLNSQTFFGAKFSALGLAYNIKTMDYVNLNNSNSTYSSRRVSEGIVSYGRDLINPPLELGALSYGINLKLIDVSSNTYAVNSLTEVDARGSGYGLDVGLLAKVTDNVKIGCVLENFLSSEIPLKGTSKTYSNNNGEMDVVDSNPYSSTEDIEPNLRLGAAIDVPVANLLITADIDNLSNNNDSGQVLHIGMEKDLILNSLSLRAGMASGDNIQLATVGMGLNVSGFNLDFAVGQESKQDEFSAVLSANIAY